MKQISDNDNDSVDGISYLIHKDGIEKNKTTG